MTKSKAAFLFASQTLGKQRLYLWTFTFKELLAVKETRKHWNHLLTLLLRQWPNLQGLRVQRCGSIVAAVQGADIVTTVTADKRNAVILGGFAAFELCTKSIEHIFDVGFPLHDIA